MFKKDKLRILRDSIKLNRSVIKPYKNKKVTPKETDFIEKRKESIKFYKKIIELVNANKYPDYMDGVLGQQLLDEMEIDEWKQKINKES